MSRPHVDVSVVTSGHDVADARLHREVSALLRHGMSVEVLGLGRPEDGPPGAYVRTWERRGPLGRAALAARIAVRARGRVVVTLDPDSAVTAGTAILASGRVLAVDVHEDFASLIEDRPWASGYGGLAGRAARRLVAAFTAIAQGAALTVVADEHVPPLTARRRLVVRNEPDPSMLPAPAAPGAVPRALYVGDVRATRGLFAMVGALRHAPGWHLDLVGPLAPADTARLQELLATERDLADRVHLHGRRPPVQAWEHAAQAWCGLLLLADTPAFREAMPSKLGEYLACGLPVVTTDLPRSARLVRTASAGVVVPGWQPAPRGAGGEDTAGGAASGVSTVGEDAGRGVAPDEGAVGEETVAAAVGAVLAGWSADPARLEEARQAARAHAPERRAGPTAYDEFAEAVAALL